MHRSTAVRRLAMLGIAATLLAGALAVFAADPDALVARAEERFDRYEEAFDFSAYRDRLEGAIALWEEALPLLPDGGDPRRAHVLNRLSRAWFELGEAYLSEAAERETAYGMAKDYALESLRLDPGFAETEQRTGLRGALGEASDVEAVFWYGNALGMWLNYHQITAIFGGVLDVSASYERAIALDESYLGGAPHRSMAALIAQAHFVLGRSRHDAVPHYERSIEIDPAYLESYVNYAEHYAGPAGDEALRDQLLDTTLSLADDPVVIGAWPLYNELAIRRARAMERGR